VSEENVATVRREFDAFAQQGSFNLDSIHPEIEIINFDSFPVTRPYRGLEGIAQWLADISEPFDDFRFELVDVLDHEDDWVVASVRATGTSRTGGPPFELGWAAIYTFRDGQLIRAAGFRSPEEALTAARATG
jgi:ketosteroid isomerase-like protein